MNLKYYLSSVYIVFDFIKGCLYFTCYSYYLIVLCGDVIFCYYRLHHQRNSQHTSKTHSAVSTKKMRPFVVT